MVRTSRSRCGMLLSDRVNRIDNVFEASGAPSRSNHSRLQSGVEEKTKMAKKKTKKKTAKKKTAKKKTR